MYGISNCEYVRIVIFYFFKRQFFSSLFQKVPWKATVVLGKLQSSLKVDFYSVVIPLRLEYKKSGLLLLFVLLFGQLCITTTERVYFTEKCYGRLNERTCNVTRRNHCTTLIRLIHISMLSQGFTRTFESHIIQ